MTGELLEFPGGVMGIGAISRAEERVLGQLEQAFGT